MFSQRFLGNEVISANAEIGVCFLQVSFGNLSDLLVRRWPNGYKPKKNQTPQIDIEDDS